MAGLIEQTQGGVLLRIKAVPGSSRDEIAGALGDRLKVRISAPAEGGKANKAIRSLLARTLGVRQRDVRIESGETSAEKTVRVVGVGEAEVRGMLGV